MTDQLDNLLTQMAALSDDDPALAPCDEDLLDDGAATRLPMVHIPAKGRHLPMKQRALVERFICSAAGRYVAVKWHRRAHGVGTDCAGSVDLAPLLWELAQASNLELLPKQQHTGAVPCNPKAAGGVTWEQAAYNAKDPNGGRCTKYRGAE